MRRIYEFSGNVREGFFSLNGPYSAVFAEKGITIGIHLYLIYRDKMRFIKVSVMNLMFGTELYIVQHTAC